jgi:hypothetical protein
MKSKRVQIILTEDIYEALRQVSDKQNSNFSAMARLAISDWLKSNCGITVDHRLAWGGNQEPVSYEIDAVV